MTSSSPDSIENFLTPISKDNPSGEALRYDPIYDQIREARREDDAMVSRGIWQYDLKKADWQTVENLTSDALQQSKDLQLVGWLGEAWLQLQGIPGLSKNMILLKRISETFWPTLYPQLDEEDGIEFRSQFFDWYDHHLMQHLISFPIVDEEYADRIVSLSEWRFAFRFDGILKRSTDTGKMIQQANQRGQLTLQQFYSFMKRLPTELIETKLKELDDLSHSFQELQTTLNTLMPENTMDFHELKPAITDLIRVYKTELETREEEKKNQTPPASPAPSSSSSAEESKPIALSADSQKPIQTRASSYQQLKEAALFLEKTEPHSPIPQILKRVLEWENKNIMEIFGELGSTPEEMTLILNFLGLSKGNKSNVQK